MDYIGVSRILECSGPHSFIVFPDGFVVFLTASNVRDKK
jgi:hypothetical protein